MGATPTAKYFRKSSCKINTTHLFFRKTHISGLPITISLRRNANQSLLIHTKTPMAFFAKHAANLCSSGNTDLWACVTHSHILAFSDESPFLQGMASIYIEEILLAGNQKKALIVRNLSIVSSRSDLRFYNASSVADSYFAMARTIAKHNGCDVCAFIEQGSQHYCTNQDSIWKAIENKYSRLIERGSVHRHEIEFNPYKNNKNERVSIFALPEG